MPKMTSNYGANGSQKNELGQRLTPKPIWGSSDHAGMARSAFSFRERMDLDEMVVLFYRKRGYKPTKLHITEKSTSAKSQGKIYPDIGFVCLDIIPNAVKDHLE